LGGERKVLLGATASGCAEARGEIGIGEDGADILCEIGIVGGGGEQGGFAIGDGFGDARAVEGGDGQGHGLSFAEDNGQAFGVAAGCDDAGRGENGGAVHEVADDGGRLRSEEGAVAQSRAGLGAERIEQGSVTNDEEFGGGMTLGNDGHGAEQMGAAFFLDEAADEENDGVAGARVAGVGCEEVDVDADGEGAEFGCGKSAGEGVGADVFRDADEEVGAGEELIAAAEEDAAGGGVVQGFVGRGGVVAVESDDEREAEVLVDGERGGGIDGEVGVEELGMAMRELAEELRRGARMKEEAAAELVSKIIAVGEGDGFCGVKLEAVGMRRSPVKTGA